VRLVSKIFNLCDPDPPTLQTDGTDDMQSQYAIIRVQCACTIVHRAVIGNQWMRYVTLDNARTVAMQPNDVVSNMASEVGSLR